MKRCPNCNQSFSDDLVFCLNDGTVLENSPISFSGDMPTIVVSPLPPQTVEKKGSNKSLYGIIGVMGIVIAGLAVFIIFLMVNSKNEEKANFAENNAVGNLQNTANLNQNRTPEKTPTPNLQITSDAAQSLINRWEQSQDSRNFSAYRALYASQFLGIKRTKSGSETRMNYTQWLNDRQKMSKNIVDVSIGNLQITVSGDTATAQFIQNFRSENYEDTGQKIIKMKMFEDGAKIIYEELKYSY